MNQTFDAKYDAKYETKYEILLSNVMRKVLHCEVTTNDVLDSSIRAIKIPFGDVAMDFDTVRYGIYSGRILTDLDTFHIGVACRKFDDTLYVVWGERHGGRPNNAQYEYCKVAKQDKFFNSTFDELVEDTVQTLS